MTSDKMPELTHLQTALAHLLNLLEVDPVDVDACKQTLFGARLTLDALRVRLEASGQEAGPGNDG